MDQPTNTGQPSSAEQQTNGIASPRPNGAAVAAGLILVLSVLTYSFFTYGSSGAGLFAPLSIVGLVILAIAIMNHQYRKSMALDVKLDKPVYSIGEALTGSIIFNMVKEKQASSLKVRFYGAERRRHHSHSSRPTHYCDAELLLSGPRTFRKGDSVRFSIPMPQDVSQYYRVATPFNSTQHWFVEAQLCIPNEIDMVKQKIVELRA